MFSMDVFCSHHKGLSKFGSLKESFVFSRGRFQKLQTLTATSALLTGLSFVNRHQKIKRFKTKEDKNKAKQTKKNALNLMPIVSRSQTQSNLTTFFSANRAFTVEQHHSFTGVHFDKLPPRSSSPTVHVPGCVVVFLPPFFYRS